MKNFNLRFFTFSPDTDESRKGVEEVESFIKRVAVEKARKVFEDSSNIPEQTIILAGDTLVLLDGKILGKPKNIEEARKMIQQLSGTTHQVLTAYAILDGFNGEELVELVSTQVTFRDLDHNLVEWYLGLGEGLDKAGAYSIQGYGTYLVTSIEGLYNNVVGFPIEQVLEILLKKGWISLSSKN